MKKLTKKAILFSLDALVALFISFVLMSSIFYYLNKIEFPRYNNLEMHEISSDFVHLLKNNNEFIKSIKNNDISNIEKYYKILPNHFCIELTILNNNQIKILNSTKTNCIDFILLDSMQYYEPIIYEDEIYITKIRGWYK
ncbi:MAG: hypothetical protein ACLFPJ_04390 [Candidatus Woesearchaeota archaeon]